MEHIDMSDGFMERWAVEHGRLGIAARCAHLFESELAKRNTELARTKRALDLAGGYLVAIVETNGEYAVQQAKLALMKIKKEIGE